MSSCDYVPDPALLGEARSFIASKFGGIGGVEAEEWASESYTRLLEKARAGERIDYPKQVIRKIARGLVIDELRKHHSSSVAPAIPLAPDSEQFIGRIDEAGSDLDAPLDEASTESRLRAVMEGMSARRRAVFKCRFALQMSVEEAASTCAISTRTIKREWREICKIVPDALEPKNFSRIQRQAVEIFLLESPPAGHWARELIESDPETWSLMRERRELLRREAGAITLEAELAALAAGAGGLSLVALFAVLRSKLGGGAAAGGGSGSSAGGGAAAGSGGGGVLAAVGGSKVVALCAGGAAACGVGGLIVSGEVGRSDAKAPKVERPATAPAPAAAARPALADPIETAPSTQAQAPQQRAPALQGDAKKPSGGKPGAGSKDGKPDASAPVPASPLTAAQEFDPVATQPSAKPAPDPSPAPTPSPPSGSGGSGGSGGGGGNATAGTEFGP